MVLSVGYAFQNDDEEEKRQKFWTHLQRIHTTGGGRTQHVSAIDGNAHVGTDGTPRGQVPMVGTAGREFVNDQGQQLQQTCESMGMRAVNTFTAKELEAQAIYSG